MKEKLDEKQIKFLQENGVPKLRWDVNNNPVYRIDDLLWLLPRVLHKEGLAYDYNLTMDWCEDIQQWRATYDAIGDNMGSKTAYELIDALFDLLCSVIDKVHWN